MEEEKNKKLRVLAIQMSSKIGDIEFNRNKVKDLIKKDNNEVDLIVLPEVWTVGWACDKFHKSAEVLENSETIKLLSELAKEKNANVLGGSFIVKKDYGSYANTCPVINREGELVATYEKMHLFSYYGCNEGSYVKNGLNPLMVNIEGVKIGLSICYDIRFSEIYRAYAKAGADLLVNMAAWPMGRKIHWHSLTTARAVENQTYFVALTQSGMLSDGGMNLGESSIISYNGEVISEISKGEGCIFAELEFQPMYEFRGKCPVLNDICDKYEVKQL